MSGELLPCPFCGREAEIHIISASIAGYVLTCEACGVRTQEYHTMEEASAAAIRALPLSAAPEGDG